MYLSGHLCVSGFECFLSSLSVCKNTCMNELYYHRSRKMRKIWCIRVLELHRKAGVSHRVPGHAFGGEAPGFKNYDCLDPMSWSLTMCARHQSKAGSSLPDWWSRHALCDNGIVFIVFAELVPLKTSRLGGLCEHGMTFNSQRKEKRSLLSIVTTVTIFV